MKFPAPTPRAALARASTAVLVLAMIAGIVAFAGAASAQASCFGRAATIVAKPGQVTNGTPGNDVIVGTSGSDQVRGRGGNDLICTGGGNDRVYAGPGRDKVDLGDGNDFGRGGRGADLIEGGPGSDKLRGRGGADVLRGGAGTDSCRGGAGADSIANCNEARSSNAPSTASPSAQSLNNAERLVADLVNDLRARNGRQALRISVDMSEVARSWSDELSDGFRHNPNVGSQIPSGWWSWGENIAYNGSAQAAFDALVDSPGHFRNMVADHFTHLGVGVVVEGGRVYVTQVFATY